jgi:hypothetical protein
MVCLVLDGDKYKSLVEEKDIVIDGETVLAEKK